MSNTTSVPAVKVEEPLAFNNPEKMPQARDHLDVPDVTWYKDPGLRKLYLLMPFLFLGATINGYDGSLLNGLQTMDPWQKCTCMRAVDEWLLTNTDFNHPTGARIGLINAMQNVGAICALPFCESKRFRAEHNGLTIASGIHCGSIGPQGGSHPGTHRCVCGGDTSGRARRESEQVRGRTLSCRTRVSNVVRSQILGMQVANQLSIQNECRPRLCAPANHGARPSPASRQTRHHVQHTVVCGVDHRSLDCVRHDQAYRRYLVDCSDVLASSHAASTNRRDLVSAGKSALAVLSRSTR